MKKMRLSDEDGLSAGWRNGGRLALAMIPAALGGAAVLWLTAAVGWIDLARTRRVERRSMESVGIAEKPTTPIVVRNHDAACLKIQSSVLDGRELLFYALNTCDRWLSGPNYLIRVKAPDGTVIKSERWAFDGDRSLAPGERREQSTRVGEDDRVDSIDLYVAD